MTRMPRLARTWFAALLALSATAMPVAGLRAQAASVQRSGGAAAIATAEAATTAAASTTTTTGITGTTRTSEADGMRMLARARDAAQSLSYSGTYIHQRGPDVRSLRIAHQRNGNTTLEKRENLDGPPGETVRRGERSLTYLPQQRRILQQDHDPAPAFPGLRALDAQRLAAHYRFRLLGDELVAGRPSSAWVLEPRDALRYGYRFWADKGSGLLLRAQTISEKAEVVEQAAFSQLSTGPLPAARLAASARYLRDSRGWRAEDASGRPASPVELAVWQAGWLPPGFEPAGAWIRKLAPAGHRGDGEREVLQLLYSDGLAGLSIFVEPWSAERSARPLQLGALNMVGKRHGKFWLTIVGEVPMLAVRQIADAIELKENARR